MSVMVGRGALWAGSLPGQGLQAGSNSEALLPVCCQKGMPQPRLYIVFQQAAAVSVAEEGQSAPADFPGPRRVVG
jgi:hypothetical protein